MVARIHKTNHYYFDLSAIECLKIRYDRKFKFVASMLHGNKNASTVWLVMIVYLYTWKWSLHLLDVIFTQYVTQSSRMSRVCQGPKCQCYINKEDIQISDTENPMSVQLFVTKVCFKGIAYNNNWMYLENQYSHYQTHSAWSGHITYTRFVFQDMSDCFLGFYPTDRLTYAQRCTYVTCSGELGNKLQQQVAHLEGINSAVYFYPIQSELFYLIAVELHFNIHGLP